MKRIQRKQLQIFSRKILKALFQQSLSILLKKTAVSMWLPVEMII